MAVFKCKMCGGTLEVNNETVAVCQYCGTKQTLPKLDDDRKANLYDRANHFRRNNEFDKAMGIYEQILNDDNTDAETYWSLVLCRYGIEYVEDPSSRKRIPTVNRAQFTSIFDDEDYKSALQYADGYQKDVYEQEATAINDIQKGILAISNQEEPFDVFICYKESDNSGRRTPDSVLATELYHELTREGYKVFFSRITLEDKLGSAYEPYIFAALNSAKVMVVLGTKPEYFNAVWVKNEWSRYLALIKNGARKMLIPAYKDMDPYDLPEEFSHLQAQDMSKLGFMQDLIRGIKKMVLIESSQITVKQTDEVRNTRIDNLLKRAFIAVEDGEWRKADKLSEEIFDIEPECADAYLIKLMVQLKIKKYEQLLNSKKRFDKNGNYQKAIRFGNTELNRICEKNIENLRKKTKKKRVIACILVSIFLIIAIFLITFNFKAFADVTIVSAGGLHTVGLRKDGTVVAVGENFFGACNVSNWNDIVSVSAGHVHTVGLRKDGTVVAVGKNDYGQCDVSNWNDIVAVSAGFHTVGLKKDGTVVAAGDKIFRKCDVTNWNGIVAISAHRTHTVGLKKDGTVVAVGKNDYGQCDVSNWNDIVAVSAGDNHTVGLKKDGTVIATGDNEFGQCDVTNWSDIIAISAADNITVGLKKDGTVVSVGYDSEWYRNTDRWKNPFKIN